MDLLELLRLNESEDKVEFKAAKNSYKYAGGQESDPKDRRHCVLGYVSAFCNEGGGMLVLGVSDKQPHQVVGSNFYQGKEGALENKIYFDLGIRVNTQVFLEDGKRVLVIKIPARPVGKTIKFEGVPLMRVGDSLTEMPDEEIHRILSEKEPDFSAKVCDGLKLLGLDAVAISKMKKAYSVKQKNSAFQRLSTEQILSDLRLIEKGKLNYAALILLGKQTAIEKYLPQSKIIWEFRFNESQIHYDKRETIVQPLFNGIDKIWELVDTLNLEIPIQNGAYISTSKSFNKEVIREAILNAIAHRDYSITSEVVIKQYPKKIVINNPGGFPKGVTLDNLLTVSSTPRCRLMAEVLEKTGLVERSGQGVDKIYSITLSEGKPEPNYKESDLFQVTLKLEGVIHDKAFHILINELQRDRPIEKKLSVEEIVTLHKIKAGRFLETNQAVLMALEKEGLIKKISGTRRYVLPDEYYQMSSKEQRIATRYTVIEIEHFLLAIQGRSLKIGDLEADLSGSLNRNQIKYLITKLFEDKIIRLEGKGRGTRYFLNDLYNTLKGDSLLGAVITHLRNKYE